MHLNAKHGSKCLPWEFCMHQLEWYAIVQASMHELFLPKFMQSLSLFDILMHACAQVNGFCSIFSKFSTKSCAIVFSDCISRSRNEMLAVRKIIWDLKLATQGFSWPKSIPGVRLESKESGRSWNFILGLDFEWILEIKWNLVPGGFWGRWINFWPQVRGQRKLEE